MHQRLNKKWPFFLLFLGVFYLFMAPQFVQGGDSAELVLAANHRLVAHPPGYPLWIWLEFLWTNAFPLGTTFWKASVLNVLFGIGGLFVLAKMAKEKPFGLCAVLVVGLSSIFLEASLIPDVFALHALLVAALFFYFFDEAGKRSTRSFLVPFVFCMGGAHQMTMVLLIPLVFWTFYESLKEHDLRNSFFKGLISGVSCMLIAYFSLFLLQGDHPFSWGNLHHLSDLWSHVLRQDYGTFQLSSQTQSSGIWAMVVFILKNGGWEISLFTGSLVLMTSVHRELWRNGRFLTGMFAVILSFAFLFFLNVPVTGAGSEVLRRFLVMPLLSLAALSIVGFRRLDPPFHLFKTILLIYGVSFGVLLFQSQGYWNLRNDTTIEDYARNVFKFSSSEKPQIFLTQLDTSYFALRYVQLHFGINSDSVVISPPLLMHSWYVQKIRQVMPSFKMKEEERIFSERHFKQEEDLINPNLSKASFIVFEGYGDGRRYKTTFLGLGRRLEEGSGVFFDELGEENSSEVPRCQIPDGAPQAYSKKFLCAQYAHYYLAIGLNQYAQGKESEAMSSWEKALDRVPYAFPALLNLCQVSKEQDPKCSAENRKRIKDASQGFF